MPEKNSLLLIRCAEETRKSFRRFVVDYDFKNYELALLDLLHLAETHPELVKVRWG